MGRAFSGLVGAGALGALLAGACGSDDEAEALRRAKLAEGCVINSDCSQKPDPLICAFRLCHIQCQTSEDCDPGLRCVLGDKPEHVCQLPEEVNCTYNSDCPGTQICGIDGECRDACKGDVDCVEGQLCITGTCADPDELVKGQLPRKLALDGGTGLPCSYHSDCPGEQVCRPNGSCGYECKADKDCAAGGCVKAKADDAFGKCGGGPTQLPEHCKTGVKDGDESAVDCGGSCYPCPSGSDCGKAGDCASQVCTATTCQEPTCSDGVRNGSESGVDCGGAACPACPPQQTCVNPSDCGTGVCKAGLCVEAGCADGQKNGKESDVDCGGGGCPPCDATKSCVVGGDCTSGACVSFSCTQPSCTDSLKNGNETGVDCGGTCKPCGSGAACTQATDCASGVCASNTCAAATCTDTAKNGAETDVDCGGPDCPKCAAGKSCAQASDCSAGACSGNVCKATFKLTVTPAGSGAGSVKSDVGGIDCGATCSADIAGGTTVVLTATAASGSTFSGWSGGGCSGTGTCSVNVSAAVTVTATFGGTAPGATVLSKQVHTSSSGSTYAVAAVDAAGNYLVAGEFTSIANFGAGNVQAVGYDGYVVRYSSTLAHVWSRKLTGSGNQRVERIVTEPGGDVLAVGVTAAAADVDLGGGPKPCAAGALIVARYGGSDGLHKWSKCVGANVQSIRAAVLAANGDLAITGTLTATTDLGAGTLTVQGQDMFIATFAAASGTTTQSLRLGGSGADTAFDLARAADGSWVLVGACSGAMDFGGGVTTTALGGEDLCVLRMTSAFAPTWARQLGGILADRGRAAAFAPNGKLVVAGSFRDQVDFGAGLAVTAKGADDIVLMQLDPASGVIDWTKTFGGTADDQVQDLALDPMSGAITLVGEYGNAFSFGGPNLTVGEAFAVKLDNQGGFLWQVALNANGNPASVESVALNAAGGAVFAWHASNAYAYFRVLAP